MIPSINGTYVKKDGTLTLQDVLVLQGDRQLLQVFAERCEKLPGQHRVLWVQGQETMESRGTRICVELQSNAVELVPGAYDPGAYNIDISTEEVKITASTSEGLANGLTTLFTLLREGRGTCACGRITDTPVSKHRGVLIDVSRHFFSVEEMKKITEQLALHKINRIHWHLSDDQGYRIESKVYPKLNEVGSWRIERDGTNYGGFYTQDEIREYVGYAKNRGIEVIPEIDLPGHVTAMLAAFPELSCSGEAIATSPDFGVHPRVLCAGKDEVLEFVYHLLDEVCELFPYEMFHVGGDEVPKDEWKKCSDCQRRMVQEGITNEEDLQTWFMGKVLQHLQTKGKSGICWNETLRSKYLHSEAVIQYWDEEGADAGYATAELVQGSRKCIYSLTKKFYYDYSPALNPMRNTYYAAPVIRDGSLIPNENLLGYEATLWAEQITTPERLEQLLFPRMFALAEIAWNGCNQKGSTIESVTETAHKDAAFAAFKELCQKELTYLDEAQVVHLSMDEADPYGQVQKDAIIEQWGGRVEMAAQTGNGQFVDIICGLVRDKIQGMFPQNEIEEIITRLRGDK